MGSPPASRQPWLTPRVVAVVVVAMAGGAVFQWFGNANQGYIATRSLFWWWVYQWINATSETQHGWLILALSAWLGWRNLRAERLRHSAESRMPGAPGSRLLALDWVALAALVGALALHTVGFVAQQARVSIVALLLFVWGLLRLAGGRRWGAAAAFPVAFLVFAIPINVLDTVGFSLRMWVVHASAAMAHAAGIGVIENGTQLVAPDGRYNYDVAAACSGVRSLMALAALSMLVGYLAFTSWWRRAIVLLLCFPLVYVGNLARIMAIVLAAQAGGTRWGNFAHEVMGYVVFLIVLGGVVGAARALERFVPEEGSSKGDMTPAVVSDGSRGADIPLPSRAYLMAGIVGLAAVADLAFLHHVAGGPSRGLVGVVLAADGRNPVELPSLLGREWVGWPAPVTAIEREVLPPDTGYSRMEYVASRGPRHVFLSIVLSGRDRTSIHRPEVCLVGQGWTIRTESEHRFTYPGTDGGSFRASLLRVTRQAPHAGSVPPPPQLVAYWFVGGDCVVPSHVERIALDAWNRVRHGRADRWAYVLMQTDASDGEEAALARMQSVLDGTLEVFAPKFSRRQNPGSKASNSSK